MAKMDEPTKEKVKHAYFDESFSPGVQQKATKILSSAKQTVSFRKVTTRHSNSQASIAQEPPPYANLMQSISAYSKENTVLRPYLRKYDNVDENVLSRKAHSTSYQLIKEEKPSMSNNVSFQSRSYDFRWNS